MARATRRRSGPTTDALTQPGLLEQRVGLGLEALDLLDVASPRQHHAVEAAVMQQAQAVDDLLGRADELVAAPAGDELADQRLVAVGGQAAGVEPEPGDQVLGGDAIAL